MGPAMKRFVAGELQQDELDIKYLQGIADSKMASGKEWARETGVKTWPVEKPLNILAMQKMATGLVHWRHLCSSWFRVSRGVPLCWARGLTLNPEFASSPGSPIGCCKCG